MFNPVKIFSFFPLIFVSLTAFSQEPQFSVATDLGVQRSFKKGQQFWGAGHTLHAHFHLTPKDGIYFWLSYYLNGEFENNAIATAKSLLTNPQEIPYVNAATMSFKHLSTGWKKYLKGTYNSENWNLYGYAGFGLLFGSVQNRHSNAIDTTQYAVPVRSGAAKFKRLTFDLGLGWETHLGGGFYLYTEGRAWIPASDYPSKYLFVNKSAPLVGMFNGGIRILFD